MASLFLISCSFQTDNLVVDKFTLRSLDISGHNESMIRGDQKKRLHGAVTKAEREGRIGQYYEVSWNLGSKISNPNQRVKVVFSYNQKGLGKDLKKMTKSYGSGTKKGKAEFNIIGDDYAEDGRALSWKVELIYGAKVIDTKRSFLWK